MDKVRKHVTILGKARKIKMQFISVFSSVGVAGGMVLTGGESGVSSHPLGLPVGWS